MIKRQFFCHNCKEKFVKEIFEEGEAQTKRVRSAPVRCPHCGSDKIERV